MDLSTVLWALLAYVPAQYVVYVLAFCGLCAVVCVIWKRPADDSKWLPLYQIVNALGANFLHAQNHSAVTVSAPAPTSPAAAIVIPPKP